MQQLQVMWIWLKWLVSLIIIGLIIVSAIHIVRMDTKSELTNISDHSSTYQPQFDWAMHHGTIQITNDQGQKVASILSVYSQHHPQSNITELNQPISVMQNQNNDHWHIQANKGYIDQDNNNLILLYGHVIMHRQASSNHSGLTLLTRAINYNPKTHQAWTHLPVVITKPHGTLHAQSFRANLNNNQIHFVNDTEVQYTNVNS